MTSLDFNQQIIPLLMALWPDFKFRGELQQQTFEYFQRVEAADLVRALRVHHRTEPDATKPKWKAVWVILKADSVGNRNDFDQLLANFRRVNKGAKGCEHWTDADVYRKYVDAQVYPIVCCTLSSTPEKTVMKPDADGRRAGLAKAEREWTADYWRGYLTRENAAIPEYLI